MIPNYILDEMSIELFPYSNLHKDKPHLRMLTGKHIWRCEGRGFAAAGVTMQQAYLLWKRWV